MDKIFMRYPQGKAKALTLSYDDGVRQDKRMIEILDRYGIKCTFNINGNGFDKDDTKAPTGKGRMSVEEAKQTYIGTEHEVALHGYNHMFMETLTPELVSYEIAKDKETLEDLFGTVIRGGAYPYGTYNDTVLSVLKNNGVKYFRCVANTERFDIPSDWLLIKPTCHHNHKLFELTEKFLNTEINKITKPMLFYVWGHTYEFDRDDNWDRIERFAETVSGKEDVWYATNIEIYDYVQAYERLEFSIAHTRVHNPSAIAIWLQVNDELVVINPGQTVDLCC